MENKVSFKLTDEEKKQVKDALGVLTSVLEPKLVSLSASDKKELPKMGDKTVAFVEKSLEYAEQYPDFVPNFIDVNESKIDLQSVRVLRQFFLPLERITNLVDSTITLAGSEAFSSSLSIYKILKNAAAMGQPGAAEATADLSNRFPGKKRTTTETVE
jgi:hypothetical protein